MVNICIAAKLLHVQLQHGRFLCALARNYLSTSHGFQSRSCMKPEKPQGRFDGGRNPIQQESQWHSLCLQCGRLSPHFQTSLLQPRLLSLKSILAIWSTITSLVSWNLFHKYKKRMLYANNFSTYLNIMFNRSISRSLSHITKCKKFEFIWSSCWWSLELNMITPTNWITAVFYFNMSSHDIIFPYFIIPSFLEAK